MANPILEKWAELKVLVESLELDVHKHANGNASAGVRARRGLRSLKAESANLVKLSLDSDKERKANKG
jgi:hypothetical protein|tara:strand:+ start:787 stop:990 length:204 start_codon:yes stop_codon:yes gene_type:complete